MSEKITAENLELVIKRNSEIREDVLEHVSCFLENKYIKKFSSAPQFALLLLKTLGLVQFPIEDDYWSGAIFLKEGKYIPVINTALPRANQFFTAWHEIYHLFFDKKSFDFVIETDIVLEERKADYFASFMMLRRLKAYYDALSDMVFLHKIFNCMSAFQSPYKAVLISLYESAVQKEDEELADLIRENFDRKFEDLPEKFREMGLDDSLVKPSYIVNVEMLQSKIRGTMVKEPEFHYHADNQKYLTGILKEIKLIAEEGNV